MGVVISWSTDLTAEIGGRDVVNHAGAAALRLLADRSGLTGGLSRALARREFVPVHDRGRVLADTAVLIADGGRVLSDLAFVARAMPGHEEYRKRLRREGNDLWLPVQGR